MQLNIYCNNMSKIYIRLNKPIRQGGVCNEIFLFIYIWNNYVDLECRAFA